jgi:mannitol 2-dehydrogenase
VLEDDFCNGRPPYERVGVQLVEDVEPYELMKLRCLNVGHQAIAYFGHLSGHTYVHEAVSDPLILELLRRYMDDEATPTLRPVAGFDLDEYKDTLVQRFQNPEVRDTVKRLCAETSDRIPKWLLPVVHVNLANGGRVAVSATIVASWARYCEGVDEKGNPITVVDRLSTTLVAIAKTQDKHPLAFIKNEELFGDLASHPDFEEPYRRTLDVLKRDGAQAALKAVLQYSYA